jgi:hypothetical protein
VVIATVWFTCWYLGLMGEQPELIRSRQAGWGVLVLGSELAAMIKEGLPVPGSVGDILAHAKAWRDADTMIGIEDVDPWGSPYFFEVVPDPKFCGENCLKVVVRSFGPNRRDDLGKVDDRQATAAVVLPLSQPSDKPAAAGRQP